MQKEKLSAEDYRVIEEWQGTMGKAIDALEKAKQFKMGDFLVLFTAPFGGSMRQEMNSYGAPTKYKVVWTSEQGIGFVKRVNKKGTPVGQLFSLTGNLDTDEFSHCEFEFRMDPEFADSILLEDDYDPSVLHKNKQEIFKAVTQHNKEVKLDTYNLHDVVDIFTKVNVGDTLWTSNVGYYLIHDKKTMSAKDFNSSAKWNLQTRIKGPFVIVLTVKDKNGKIKEVTPDFFHQKALYKERPRTYKELKV